ncbi:MAG: hypothetical protein ACI86H_001166 [bacterium]|jgi:hypothetical protein
MSYKTRRSVLFLIVFVSCMIFLSSCSGKGKYHAGLYTTEVYGKVSLGNLTTLPELSEEERPFILVQKYHRLFIQTSQGYLERVSASIVYPQPDGSYIVKLGDEVTRLDLFYIAKGYLQDVVNFRRSLGIGKIEYNPILRLDPNWQQSFSIQLRPFLSGFVVEQRYQMPLLDQVFLGKWLNPEEKAKKK